MLFAISNVGDFLLTTAAILGALATIVASMRALGHIKLFAAIGRALVGDPLKSFIHSTVEESQIAEQMRENADRINDIERRQEATNGSVREAIEHQTEVIESLRRQDPPQT